MVFTLQFLNAFLEVFEHLLSGFFRVSSLPFIRSWLNLSQCCLKTVYGLVVLSLIDLVGNHR
jgi:hypothetical protein